MTTDKLLKIEKIGRVYRALYVGPNGPVTLCSCGTKRATEINAEFILRTMPRNTWTAFISQPNITA